MVLAAQLTYDSRTTTWEIGSSWDLAPTLELSALVLTAGDKPGLATQLLATAARLRVAMPYPLGASDRPAITHSLETVRSSLGDMPFARAWNAGRQAPLDASVLDALAGLATLAGLQSSASRQED